MLNVLEAGATAPATADIFTEAGNTMTGFMSMTGNFFNGLWEHPMGKIIVTLGIVSAGIGLCYELFLRKKHI